MQPLQGQISVSQLRDDPEFNAMAPEIQAQYLSEEFLPKADPTFNQLPANLRSQYIQEEVMPQIRPVDVKGVGDTGFGEGIGNVANALGQWAYNVPGQVGQAFNTELQNTVGNPYAMAEKYFSIAPMAVEGVRDLFQAPADLLAASQNAYTQTDDFKPLYTLPSTRDLPVVGGWIGEQMDKYPVFNFAAGNVIPVEAGLGAVGKAVKNSGTSKAAKASKPLARVKAPNAVYGDFGKSVGVRSQGRFMPQGQVINRDTQRFIQDTQKFQGIDPKNTAQVQSKAYKQAFEQLEQAARNYKSPTLTARIKQAQSQLQKQYQTAQPAKAVKAQKINLAPDSDDFKALVEYTQQLRQAGRVKEADMALGQFDNATRAKAYDQVKIQEAQAKQQRLEVNKQERLKARAEKKQYEAEFKKLVEEEKTSQSKRRELEKQQNQIQNLKTRQATKDQLALEKAQSKQRQKEMQSLRAEIQKRAATDAEVSKQIEVEAKQFDAQARQKVSEQYKRLAAEEKAAQLKQKELKASAEKTQNLKDRQTSNDLLALEKAESKNRQRELRQLKGQIQERASEQKAQAKQQDGPKQQNTQRAKPDQQAAKPGESKNKTVKQTPQQIRSAIKAAKKDGESVILHYEAEKYGETGQFQRKEVHDPDIEVNNKGAIQVKAINSEGQIRTYLEEDVAGSRIVSVERTGKKAQFVKEVNAEGKTVSKAVNSGDVVAQVKKEGTKSSELRANLDKMQSVLDRVKKGQSVTAEEIRDAARPMSEPEFIDNGKNLDRDKINELGRKVDC